MDSICIVKWVSIVIMLIMVIALVWFVVSDYFHGRKTKREAEHRAIKNEKYTHRRKKKGMN